MSKSGEKVNKITIATREKTYYQKFRNEDTNQWETVEVAHGQEIVKEVNASDAGLKLFNEMTPEDRALLCKELMS